MIFLAFYFKRKSLTHVVKNQHISISKHSLNIELRETYLLSLENYFISTDTFLQ